MRRIVHIAVGLLAVVLLASLFSCGGQTTDACATIYETCHGALLDEEGTSLSQDSCVRKMDELSRSDPQVAGALFDCIAAIEEATCDELASCF